MKSLIRIRHTSCFWVVAIVFTVPTFAQFGVGYDLAWSTIDGGGVMFSVGGGYELGGTIGQPDAGEQSGESYDLTGGFWFGIGGFPCGTVSDCAADPANNACNCAACMGNICQYTCTRFGNVNCEAANLVNLDDVLCVLAGFSVFASCPNGDIDPCGGDGIIDLDDILAVIAGFGGGNPCGCNAAETSPLCGSVSP